MRLLLDEHYPPWLAEQLRQRGYDVVATVERPDLRGLADSALFAQAQHMARVMTTENARDYLPLHHATFARGLKHQGLLITSPRRFPRTAVGFGRLVEALTTFLATHASEDTIETGVLWL